MTITQLEYIAAVAAYGQFAVAADKCFVTQPTLSMQIQKLEKELGVIIFDRSRQPIVPTDIGHVIIQQARVILNDASDIKEIVKNYRNIVSGDLRIGVIPTVAPYLMPLFLDSFSGKYPNISLQIEELLTMQIVDKIKSGLLDLGIVSTPLGENGILEIPILYDTFVIYLSRNHPLCSRKTLSIKDVDINDIWLLTEGYCFRNQIVNLCETTRQKEKLSRFRYKTGSLETIIKLMKKQGGVTILPSIALLDMSEQEKKFIREFNAPKPRREISIIMKKGFYKTKMIELLKDEILANLPAHLRTKSRGNVIEWK
jgi:LysR family hydrogen peroxide-inducible transcriptional activator